MVRRAKNYKRRRKTAPCTAQRRVRVWIFSLHSLRRKTGRVCARFENSSPSSALPARARALRRFIGCSRSESRRSQSRRARKEDLPTSWSRQVEREALRWVQPVRDKTFRRWLERAAYRSAPPRVPLFLVQFCNVKQKGASRWTRSEDVAAHADVHDHADGEHH
jgi:hypothetical protein